MGKGENDVNENGDIQQNDSPIIAEVRTAYLIFNNGHEPVEVEFGSLDNSNSTCHTILDAEGKIVASYMPHNVSLVVK